MVVGGPKITTDNVMSKRNSQTYDKDKLQQIVELLKFVMSLDDEEIIKSTIESVIELLEEEIAK